MSSRHDSNDDSGARELDGDVQTGGGEVDPEDKATELWAPVARDLFKDELLAKVMRNAGGPAAADEHETSVVPTPREPVAAPVAKQAPATRSAPVTAPAPALDPNDTSTSPGFEPAVEHSRPQIPRIEPEEQATVSDGPEPEELPTLPAEEPEEDPTLPEAFLASQSISGELETAAPRREPEDQDTDRTPVMVDGLDGETLCMSPQERAASFGAKQRTADQDEDFARAEEEANRLLEEKVEVSGEEGEAARRLAYEAALRARDDTESTVIVETPRYVKPVPHECRICGHKITKPRTRRLRGPVHSVNGFRCEKCFNVFCAAHVERVSGLWESIVRGARFRCLLCMEDAQREIRASSRPPAK